MTCEPDPYRDLLGIKSAGEPDHYALLGLEPYESDRRKIDDAAGDRMSVLQEFANSEHLDASQKLLNEVSAARRCLLDVGNKIAYDEDLRRRQMRSAGSGSQRGRHKQQTGSRRLPVAVFVVVAVVLLIVVAVVRRDPVASGNLVIEWPVNQRNRASVTMDGKFLALPETDPIHLDIPDGRHRILFSRSGYEDIPKTIHFSGARVRLKLRWIRAK
jgi:hypothetical protein